MSKKKNATKAKAPKATKSAKATTPGVQVKKDARGRFWLVAKDGGEERGPFATKKEALEAKAAPAGSAPVTDGKATKANAAKTRAPKEKKVSAIDAAAQVLAKSKEAMNCKEMIDAMEKQALWTSPGGKTPHATLYSAIIREIQVKGNDARFVKSERGHFTVAGNGAAAPKASVKKAAKKTKIADGTPGPKSLSKLFKI